jgi:hypothetical protein
MTIQVRPIATIVGARPFANGVVVFGAGPFSFTWMSVDIFASGFEHWDSR